MEKSIDGTWQTYGVGVIKDYLERAHILDSGRQIEIIDVVMMRYANYLLNEPHFDVQHYIAFRKHNRDVKGVIDEVVWWSPFTWHRRITLAENEGSSLHELNLYSGSQVMLMGLSAVTITTIATYYTFRALSNLKASFYP